MERGTAPARRACRAKARQRHTSHHRSSVGRDANELGQKEEPAKGAREEGGSQSQLSAPGHLSRARSFAGSPSILLVLGYEPNEPTQPRRGEKGVDRPSVIRPASTPPTGGGGGDRSPQRPRLPVPACQCQCQCQCQCHAVGDIPQRACGQQPAGHNHPVASRAARSTAREGKKKEVGWGEATAGDGK